MAHKHSHKSNDKETKPVTHTSIHRQHTAIPAGLTEQQLYAFIFAFRVINALSIKTYFNPDEYWQCLEVAHYDVFGYGYKTWEWTQEWKIRSYSHVSIISLLYFVMKLLGLDTSNLVINLPKVLHGLGTAKTDIMMYECTKKWFKSAPANYAVI